MSDPTDIRGRITRLTLAVDLPREVWSELCKIDSDLLATLARMAPVVAAADAWLDDPCKGLGSHSEHDLEAAVRAYRAIDPAPGS